MVEVIFFLRTFCQQKSILNFYWESSVKKNSVLWKLLIIMNNETFIRHMKTTIEKLSVTNSEFRENYNLNF